MDTDTMLVVATGLTQAANDKQHTPMVETLGALPEALGEISELLARWRQHVRCVTITGTEMVHARSLIEP